MKIRQHGSPQILLISIIIVIILALLLFLLLSPASSTSSSLCVNYYNQSTSATVKSSSIPSSQRKKKSAPSKMMSFPSPFWLEKRKALLVYPLQATWEFSFVINDLLSDFLIEKLVFVQNVYPTTTTEQSKTEKQQQHQQPQPYLAFHNNGTSEITAAVRQEKLAFFKEKKKKHSACHPNRPRNNVNKKSDDDGDYQEQEEDESSPSVKTNDFPVRILVVPTIPQFTLDQISQLLQNIKPHICLSISDEAGVGFRQFKVLSQSDETVWNDFPFRPRTCHLILKQYQHHDQQSKQNKKIVRVPLGYRTNMFSLNQSQNFNSMLMNLSTSSSTTGAIVASSRRKFKWSFFGQIYPKNDSGMAVNDRIEMFETFSEWKPFKTNVVKRKKENNTYEPGTQPETTTTTAPTNSSHVSSSSPLSKTPFDSRLFVPVKEVGSYYSNSKFVPIGRGFFSLECFRIYEAVSNGAIPVIVAKSKRELMRTFGSFIPDDGGGQLPEGWIFADSWSAALEKVRKLDQNPDELDKLQRAMIVSYVEFWKRVKGRVRNEVEENVDRMKCW